MHSVAIGEDHNYHTPDKYTTTIIIPSHDRPFKELQNAFFRIVIGQSQQLLPITKI